MLRERRLEARFLMDEASAFGIHPFDAPLSSRISSTSWESYGVPSFLKTSWNHGFGSSVYFFFQESHG